MSAARSIGGALADARLRLAAAGIEQAALDARLLVAEAAGCDTATLIGHPEAPLDADRSRRLEDMLGRRLRSEPLAHILGRREFWSLDLLVTRATLIPRPDSETVVEAALAHLGRRPRPQILDLGTGSGCLLIALLHELPDAYGVGVDRSEAALAVARANAGRCGVAGRAAFVRADWADAIGGRFDVVVANPPYVTSAEWPGLAPDVRNFEPVEALVAGEDGLAAYRRIAAALPRLLADGGAAFVEIGGASAAGALQTFRTSELRPIMVRRDLGGRRRCIGITAEANRPTSRGADRGAKKNVGNPAVPV